MAAASASVAARQDRRALPRHRGKERLPLRFCLVIGVHRQGVLRDERGRIRLVPREGCDDSWPDPLLDREIGGDEIDRAALGVDDWSGVLFNPPVVVRAGRGQNGAAARIRRQSILLPRGHQPRRQPRMVRLSNEHEMRFGALHDHEVLSLGVRALGVGRWALGAGPGRPAPVRRSPVPGPRSPAPGPRSPVPGPRSPVPSPQPAPRSDLQVARSRPSARTVRAGPAIKSA